MPPHSVLAPGTALRLLLSSCPILRPGQLHCNRGKHTFRARPAHHGGDLTNRRKVRPLVLLRLRYKDLLNRRILTFGSQILRAEQAHRGHGGRWSPRRRRIIGKQSAAGATGEEDLALGRSPGIVEVPLAHAQVKSTNGTIIPSEEQLGKTVFSVNDPGLYTAIEGDTRLHIAVNLVNADLSNINRSVLKADAPAAGRDDGFRRELWFYMLLFAVVLIGFEWFTYNRGITL